MIKTTQTMAGETGQIGRSGRDVGNFRENVGGKNRRLTRRLAGGIPGICDLENLREVCQQESTST
jgi:hypothetical protein